MASNKAVNKRYEWLDQFRGLVVLFLILSCITWELSGNWSGDDPILGPTFLNHGFCYYDGDPAIITIIDIGQQVFMFVLGFVGYISFRKRLENISTIAAWRHGLVRVGLLYLLAMIDDGVLEFILNKSFSIQDVLYAGTFANLAIGSFAAYFSLYIIKNAEKRMVLALIIMTIHSFLYANSNIIHYSSGVESIFPFNAINHGAIAIIGTCFGQWYKAYEHNPDAAFKARILPVSTFFLVACYLLDWLQPAEHHDVTTALALMAVGRAGFMIALFYGLERIGFKIPLLSEFGKNMLLMFVLTPILQVYINIYSKNFLSSHPVTTLLLIGIFPVLLLAGLAVFLDRKNMVLKI
ncbi:hypothetical protein [Desulfoplanes sp.]